MTACNSTSLASIDGKAVACSVLLTRSHGASHVKPIESHAASYAGRYAVKDARSNEAAAISYDLSVP